MIKTKTIELMTISMVTHSGYIHVYTNKTINKNMAYKVYYSKLKRM